MSKFEKKLQKRSKELFVAFEFLEFIKMPRVNNMKENAELLNNVKPKHDLT